MLVLVIAILYGFVFAYFATQNTLPVTLTLGNYIFSGVPLYLIALGSLLMGTLLALIINLIESVPTNFVLRNSENRISEASHTIEDQAKRIHALEIENLQLRQDHPQAIAYENPVPPVVEKRSVWERIKDNLRPRHDSSENFRHV